jgi:deoxyribose-phosphate aldolase
MENLLSKAELASRIEHSLLNPLTTQADIKKLCAEAVKQGFFGVCVPPHYVQYACQQLEGKKVRVITVAGFPFGYDSSLVKAEAIKKAIEDGADEVDMVINLSALKSGKINLVREEIISVSTLCRMHSRKAKVIIEAALLTEEELLTLCRICTEAGAHFVKTSTGFNGPGASVEMVRKLRENLPASVGIKASGGIRTKEQALELIAAGADRIGTSSGMEIIQE